MSKTTARSLSLLAVATLAAGALPFGLGSSSALAAGADPSVVGSFARPFEEAGAKCTVDKDSHSQCKPAGASVVVLPNGKLVYWDALEGFEDVRYGTVPQYGDVAQNDKARLLDLGNGSPTFTASDPNAVSNPKGNDNEYLPVVPHNNDNKGNDGDLFCSDQVLLSNGKVLDVGGTAYYLEPGVSGVPVGATELEGLHNSRLYDGNSNTWSASGRMQYGRWYPSLVTLPDNDVFVASGVTKLIKPAYDKRPTDSGTNVTQTETYDTATGKWSYNGDGGKKSLPLFPRLHLLPNGHVYYDAGGQTFNPSGQSYDEALWNTAASYNPKTKTWSDLGMPKFDGVLSGFRGSAFSQMLTLKPDANGAYTKAQFLGAGGVYGVSPGTYLASKSSTINTVTTAGGKEAFSSENTGPLNAARWYSTGVTLPTGQVLAFSGADRDEVVLPGTGTPVTTPEMFEPSTGKWTKLAAQSHSRTYHNTAVLLPDGRVMVGGHAPIATGYGNQIDAGTAAGLSSPFRDPSFEIFSPPNLFYGPRPVITGVDPSIRLGKTVEIATPDAADVSTVTLVRNTAITHLVDGDQRVVELPVVSRTASTVTVNVTDNAAVLPQGPYNLFINNKYAKGLTPSVGRQVFVGAVPAAFADDIAMNNANSARSEMAARRAAIHGRSGSAPGHAKGKSAKGKSSKGHDDSSAVGATDGTPAIPVGDLPAARLAAAESSTPAVRWLVPVGVLAFGTVAGRLLYRRRRTV